MKRYIKKHNSVWWYFVCISKQQQQEFICLFLVTDLVSVVMIFVLQRDLLFTLISHEAWESEGVRIENSLLMYEGIETCKKCKGQPAASQRNHGARYLVPFSLECPHFEVGRQNRPPLCLCSLRCQFHSLNLSFF